MAGYGAYRKICNVAVIDLRGDINVFRIITQTGARDEGDFGYKICFRIAFKLILSFSYVLLITLDPRAGENRRYGLDLI